MPAEDIQVNFAAGRATMQSSHIPIFDYHDIPNALFGGGPAPIAGSVSYTVAWNNVKERLNIKNTDPVFGGFGGEFVHTEAKMEWTASAGDYRFVSDPLSTSTSSFAEIGKERNGVFFNNP